MDRTVKFLLGLIALSLISLNLQLAGFELVGEAKAALSYSQGKAIENGLKDIQRAIDRIECN